MRILAVVLKIYVFFLRFSYMPVSIYKERYGIPYSFSSLYTPLVQLVDNTSLAVGLPPVLSYRRDQQRCGKRSSGL